ncbi:MAG: FHA domain-containing protein [Candidatus Limisoma sp.]
MDNAIQTINVTCPHCSKQMRMRNPMKPGVYKVTCVACNNAFHVKIVDKTQPVPPVPPPVPQPEPQPAPQPEPQPVPPPVPQPEPQPVPPPVPQPEPQHEPQEDLIVKYCTSCGVKLRIRNPKPGEHQIKCPKCGNLVAYQWQPASQPTPQPAPQPVPQPAPQPAPQPDNDADGKTKVLGIGFNKVLVTGQLLLKKGFMKHDEVFDLSEARDYIIGRNDPMALSDINVDDPTMSRQSVKISASVSNNGSFLYKLCVLRSTNKVMVNGRPVSQGDSVFLEFGDSFVLGRSTFVFQKSKEIKL